MENFYNVMISLQNDLAGVIEYLLNIKGFIWLQLVISCITIWMTLMAGNKHPKAWLVGLLNQGLWITMIVWTEAWGLVPLCLAMCVVYYRNHRKWRMDQLAAKARQPVFVVDTIADLPKHGVLSALYQIRANNSLFVFDGESYQLVPVGGM